MTVSLMSAIRRRPGMARSDFFNYLFRSHGALATQNPLGLSSYRQNHVLDLVAGQPGDLGYGVAPDRDNVTELEFPDLEALFSTMGHPYTREVLGPDGANFSDLPTATALVVKSHDVPVPAPGEGASRVIAFLSATPTLSLEDFAAALDDGLETADKGQLSSVTVHHRVAEGDTLVGYFGGEDAPSYQAALTMTFTQGGPALPDAARLLGNLGPAVDASRSFAALVDVRELYRAY